MTSGALSWWTISASGECDTAVTLEAWLDLNLTHPASVLGDKIPIDGVAAAITRWSASSLPKVAGWLFVAGTVLFSGSLYFTKI